MSHKEGIFHIPLHCTSVRRLFLVPVPCSGLYTRMSDPIPIILCIAGWRATLTALMWQGALLYLQALPLQPALLPRLVCIGRRLSRSCARCFAGSRARVGSLILSGGVVRVASHAVALVRRGATLALVRFLTSLCSTPRSHGRNLGSWGGGSGQGLPCVASEGDHPLQLFHAESGVERRRGVRSVTSGCTEYPA